MAETQDLIAVHKPASMPVHACGQYRKNTVMALLQVERPDLGKLFPVHRLDKPVSGLLLIAKTAAAAKAVGTQITVSLHSPGGMLLVQPWRLIAQLKGMLSFLDLQWSGSASLRQLAPFPCRCLQIMNVVNFCCCKCKIITFIYLLKDTLRFWHDTALHMFPVVCRSQVQCRKHTLPVFWGPFLMTQLP